MPAPNQEQLDQFRYYRDKTRVMTIWGYLYDGESMDAVGRRIFPGETGIISHKVSLIMRCYGFEGNNSGIFSRWILSDGSSFTSCIEKEDVEAFVRKFPNGCQYTGDGEQMRQFLSDRLEKKLLRRKKEAAKRAALLKSELDRKRYEEEKRRQKEAERARLIKLREEEKARVEKEIWEARQRAIQYAEEQASAKAKAESLAQEAEIILKNAKDDNDYLDGIAKYLEAFEISWEETDPFGVGRVKTSLYRPDYRDFLMACEQMAIQAYNNDEEETAILFCKAACMLPERGSIWFDTYAQNFKDRNEEFHPEVSCLEIMRRYYLKKQDLKQAEYICALEEKAIWMAKMKPEDILIDTISYVPVNSDDSDIDALPDLPEESDDDSFEQLLIEEECDVEDVKYEKYAEGMLICVRKHEYSVYIPMQVCATPVFFSGSIHILAKSINDEWKLIRLGYNPFSDEITSTVQLVEGLKDKDNYELIVHENSICAIDGDVSYKLLIPFNSSGPIETETAAMITEREKHASNSGARILYRNESINIQTSEKGGVFVQNADGVIAYPEISDNCQYAEGLIIDRYGEKGYVLGIVEDESVFTWFKVFWR